MISKIAAALLLAPASAWVPTARPGSSLRHGVVPSVVEGGESRALIVQNKGGGHGELGFHLALQLANDKGLKVTVLHDGGPEPMAGKEPWDSYNEAFGAAGVDLKWADLSATNAADAVKGCGAFEFIFDNHHKDADAAAPLAALAKGWKCSNYVFVSSGGMYKGAEQPMREGDETKSTGQRAVEELLAAEGLPWTSFRPQYIYGPKTNKREYIDWFIDRVIRGRKLPIPNAGDQIVSLTNAEDVASLLASAIGNEKAVGQVFNCGTDAEVTYNELCDLVADLVGKPAETVSYNPADFKDLPKGAFPFRNTAFFVNVDKAKADLGWAPKHNLKEDLASFYYPAFLADGLDKKDKAFAADNIILGSN